jgi:cytoskeletal protein CcmA (bactofilin family)
VTVRGKITGAIRSLSVTLQSSARVEGDIHQMSLLIEKGAEFDGRCRRPVDASELRVDLNPASHRNCARLIFSAFELTQTMRHVCSKSGAKGSSLRIGLV